MAAPEQIAERAARKVCKDNGIKRADKSEQWVQALAWEMGEGVTYESGMHALVAAAIEIDTVRARGEPERTGRRIEDQYTVDLDQTA